MRCYISKLNIISTNREENTFIYNKITFMIIIFSENYKKKPVTILIVLCVFNKRIQVTDTGKSNKKYELQTFLFNTIKIF